MQRKECKVVEEKCNNCYFKYTNCSRLEDSGEFSYLYREDRKIDKILWKEK